MAGGLKIGGGHVTQPNVRFSCKARVILGKGA